MNKLEIAREIINKVDKEMSELFEERMKAAKMVAEYKALYNTEPLYKACKYHDAVIELRNRLRKEV